MTTHAKAAVLDAMFNPKSIAVVGASTKPFSVGNDVLRNLIFNEFNGPVYPINPKANAILGIHCFKSLNTVPGPVDLAVVVVPPAGILEVVEQAKQIKVKAMIVLSAGFKETGPEGAAMEIKLRDAVRAAGIPLIGPNCLGVMNTDPLIRLNATFGRKMAKPGNLAFISQSGALCTSVLDYAEERHIGFSKFISFGNKADANEIDLLHYLAEDEKTKVIAMYLEDVSNGRDFIETAREIFWKTGKPMLCLKSGRSEEGAKAVSSHTGSLAGSDSLYDALLIQGGVQRVDTIGELFDFAALYTTQPMPKGKRVGIITNAGGPGIMATDAVIRNGLSLAQLEKATQEKMRPHLPTAASLRNPVDVIGDARSERYRAAVRTVLEDPNVDMGLVILTPQSMTDVEATAAVIPEAVKGINKPVVCSFMGARDVAKGAELLREAGIPNYPFPEDAVRALAAADQLVTLRDLPNREDIEYRDVDRARAHKLIQEALGDQKERYLTQAQVRPLLEAYGFPLLKSGIARTADEAGKIAREFEGKVAMKVMSEDVVHKFDAGGVMLNVQGQQGGTVAYETILKNVEKAVPGARIQGVLIESMAKPGVEVILGATRDPRFGPLVMFGLGGTFVEVMKDVTFRLAPMWRVSAQRMIRQIRAFKLLAGVRGNPPADLTALEDTLLRLSALVWHHPEIAEIDINPLIVHAEGQRCSVADSRILLRKTQ